MDFLANPDAIHKLRMFEEYLTLISRAVKQIYTILQTAVAFCLCTPTQVLERRVGVCRLCLSDMFQTPLTFFFKIPFWLFGNKICGFKSWQICVICVHNFQILFYPSIQYNSHGPSLPVGSIDCLVWGVYLLLRWTAVGLQAQLQLLARWWQKERWEAAKVLSWRNYILLLLTTLRRYHFSYGGTKGVGALVLQLNSFLPHIWLLIVVCKVLCKSHVSPLISLFC